jgi:protease IV
VFSESSRVILNFLKGFWRTLVAIKDIVLTVLVVGLLLILLRIAVSDSTPSVPNQAALTLRFDGYIVEQATTTDPLEAVVTGDSGLPPETLLRDIVESIDRAAEDKRIRALALELDYFVGAGPATLETIGSALKRFKATGKPIVAYGQFMTEPQYYVAAHASEIMLNPMGAVLLRGYGLYDLYMKDALEKVKVDINVFRVGKYKSFVEPFTRSDMSPEAREAANGFLADIWGDYVADVQQARRAKAFDITTTINQAPQTLAQYGGDFAAMAKGVGAVDALATYDAFTERMIELVGEGESDDGLTSYAQVDMRTYLQSTRASVSKSKDKIGIIYVNGDIIDGEAPTGVAAGDTVARQIRRALNEESIRALVVRIDSPGGSATASELIRSELELAQQRGIPVVASMGTVAASGGYWIASTSDEIWAQPSTITGSIGIFGILPTFQRTLSEIGVNSDGVGTTTMSDSGELTRALSPEFQAVMQNAIEHGYRQFLGIVAKGRKLSVAQVDQIAQGRPWSGAAARQLKLVDRLGDLEDAVASAAKRAKITDYDVVHVEEPLPWQIAALEQILQVREQPIKRIGVSASSTAMMRAARAIALVERQAGQPYGITACLSCLAVSGNARDWQRGADLQRRALLLQ